MDGCAGDGSRRNALVLVWLLASAGQLLLTCDLRPLYLAEFAYTRRRFLDVDRTCHDLRFSSAVTAKEYVMTRALISLSAPLTPTVPLEPSRFLISPPLVT